MPPPHLRPHVAEQLLVALHLLQGALQPPNTHPHHTLIHMPPPHLRPHVAEQLLVALHLLQGALQPPNTHPHHTLIHMPPPHLRPHVAEQLLVALHLLQGALQPHVARTDLGVVRHGHRKQKENECTNVNRIIAAARHVHGPAGGRVARGWVGGRVARNRQCRHCTAVYQYGTPAFRIKSYVNCTWYW